MGCASIMRSPCCLATYITLRYCLIPCLEYDFFAIMDIKLTWDWMHDPSACQVVEIIVSILVVDTYFLYRRCRKIIGLYKISKMIPSGSRCV